MHDTAHISGTYFGVTYGDTNMNVVDIGGADINGSLRGSFQKLNMKYTVVDIEAGPGVDIVIKPGEKLPFETGSVDLIVSSSCFEHDPCFWITFKEMCRIVKLGGYIYINAPSNGVYHKHPGDNWRFYSDAGQALAYWSGIQMGNEEIHPVKVEETFHILPLNDIWTDWVCVWKRVEEKDTNITVSDTVSSSCGPLATKLIEFGLRISSKICV